MSLDATVHLAFALDIGYEIDLERARPLLAGVAGPLARRSRTPDSIRYRPAPVRVAVDASGVVLTGVTSAGPIRSEMSVFDFGAVSLRIAVPVRLSPAQMTSLAGTLADPAPLTAAARLVLAPWIERLRPGVTGFRIADPTEEYVVFQLGPVEPGWLDQHAAWVAGLVRLESGPLSDSEIEEATRRRITYAPNDLVVLDWAAGLVADRDCDDTLQVIEFANVQLLEFRLVDDQLDDRLESAYRLIHPVDASLPPGSRVRWRSGRPWATHDDALRHLRELELEATSVFERTDNALKLIGDQYLARVYALASARFHLDDWQTSIRRKLDAAGHVFDLLAQQAGVLRLEALEIVVILLIALEIVLALVRH